MNSLRDSINERKRYDEDRNTLFLFPFMNKKERLDTPFLGWQKIALPHMERFEVSQQETKDTCGLAAAKMVMKDILKSHDDNHRIEETDIIKTQVLAKSAAFQNYIWATPNQLKTGINDLLKEHKIRYRAEVKHFLGYPVIKQYISEGSYMIFTYMGDTVDNPYRMKDGKKDASLQGVHHPHYCVLLEIDEPSQLVTIANPFWYTEKLPFKEFRARISLHPAYLRSSKLYLPLVESGLYMPRTCVVVKKKS